MGKFDGYAVIEAALTKASRGNLVDAPFPMVGEEAKAYLMGAAAAYQHALEMIPAPIENARMREALEKIAKRNPPYTGDYDYTATPSDFGNQEDYARELGLIANAANGDIARDALATP